jgi:hypothetical protein
LLGSFETPLNRPAGELSRHPRIGSPNHLARWRRVGSEGSSSLVRLREEDAGLRRHTVRLASSSQWRAHIRDLFSSVQEAKGASQEQSQMG